MCFFTTFMPQFKYFLDRYVHISIHWTCVLCSKINEIFFYYHALVINYVDAKRISYLSGILAYNYNYFSLLILLSTICVIFLNKLCSSCVQYCIKRVRMNPIYKSPPHYVCTIFHIFHTLFLFCKIPKIIYFKQI